MADAEEAQIESENYNDAQKLILAFEALHLIRRKWFSVPTGAVELPRVVPAPDRFMSALLMSVYAYWLAGSPLHKRAAWVEMAADDIKTGRKYILRAQELGFDTNGSIAYGQTQGINSSHGSSQTDCRL